MWPTRKHVLEKGREKHVSDDGEEVEFVHFCRYHLMRKSFRSVGSHQQWMERCRCGRVKAVDWNPITEGANSPTITVDWFDPFGKLSRRTGHNSYKESINASIIRDESDNNDISKYEA